MLEYDEDWRDDARDYDRLMADDGHDECDPLICSHCNGSGEGQHEGTTCTLCNGSGECSSQH